MQNYTSEAAREVAAVEIDKTLLPILDDTLKDWDNVTVINNDILCDLCRIYNLIQNMSIDQKVLTKPFLE